MRIYPGVCNDERKTYKHLEAVARLAKQNGSLSGEYIYATTLLNWLKSNADSITKTRTGNQSEKFLNDILDSHFDSSRDKDWLRAIIDELEATIN